MLRFPPSPANPEIPDDRRATGQVPVRFEDITQDGRLALEGMAPALGEIVWRRLLAKSEFLKALRAHEAVPILTRLVVEGGDGPFSTYQPLEATGCYDIAHVATDAGAVERILLDMWIDATLPIGRNYGPPPERAGERIPAGRIFGEHVLTRLFAAPDKRKVTHLEDAAGAPMIGRRRAWVAPESVGVLPEGAVPLDQHPFLDPTPISFGLAHTDSNQHVNSLVYPRLFEDAALRRFARLGKLKPTVLSRHVEAAFRKPCFAGETYAIALQTFMLEGQLGAVGAFVSGADADGSSARTAAWSAPGARPHCFVRMVFA